MRIAKFSTIPKRFTINGAIGVEQYEHYFVLDPKEENEKSLLPSIRRGDYVMLHGTRGSGKSTRMYRAIDQLKDEFFCLHISLEGIPTSSFVQHFLERLNARFPLLPRLQTMTNFEGLFTPENMKTIFGNKKVVLFIDEFDQLYSAPKEVQKNFMGSLRCLKQECKNVLHSVVGVGPFSILALGAETGSPFNVAEKIEVTYWSKEQVGQLLRQYSVDILDDVIDDIYLRTSGHAGLVCNCGKVIAERDNSLGTDFGNWLQYATTKLEKEVTKWLTMDKLLRLLSYTGLDAIQPFQLELAKQARALLRRERQNGLLPFTLKYFDESRVADYLVAEGALLSPEKNVYKIPSPLIYSMISSALAVDRRNIKEIYPNFTKLEAVKELIGYALQNFDTTTMNWAFTHSHKKSRAPKTRNEQVPEEAAYLAEFHSILREALSTHYGLALQVNVPGSTSNNSRCDVLLHANFEEGNNIAVFEFVANTSREDVAEHAERIDKYAKLLNARQAWLIHFTIADAKKDCFPLIYERFPKVNVINIYHSPMVPFKITHIESTSNIQEINPKNES